MNYQGNNDFIDYYELLKVAEDASEDEIRRALEMYRQSMTKQLGNVLNMQSARYAINVIIPKIEKSLLSGREERRKYDQERVARRNEIEHHSSEEPAEGEGLDLRVAPFFFDPYNGYDTEPETSTLREIAGRLDEDWTQTRIWFTNKTSRIHPMVGYLTFGALRPRLAVHIGQIIEQATQSKDARIDINEGIERCINIFNPAISRPFVGIESSFFDGKILDLGNFLPDGPSQSEVTLAHQGMRGCAFGTVESLTPWITFANGEAAQHFALLPEGTTASTGPTKIKIPLFFQFHTLAHKQKHTGALLIRLENYDPPLVLRVPVVLYLAALPPLVSFEPSSTEAIPLRFPAKRRDEGLKLLIMPRNSGDEAYIPLVARITSEDQGASADPEQFRANQPITLIIDTKNRPFGEIYDIKYSIDYRQVTGAKGQEAIYIRGEILPNFWQSMYRTKAVGERIVASCLLGVVGFFVLAALGGELNVNRLSVWFLFPLIPLLLLGAMSLIVTPIIVHIKQSGKSDMEKEKISPYIKWVLPLSIGIVLVFLCELIQDVNLAIVLEGVAGALVGMIVGFLRDRGANQNGRIQNPYG